MPSRSNTLRVLNVLAALLVGVAFYLAVFFAPTEATLGNAQKVFYFHVANAWVGLLGFIVAAAAGVAYLRSHDQKWDIVEVAAVEISLVCFFIAIVLGSIWAKSAWNTWWTWDARLTTAAIVELVYVAYLMLRNGIEDPDRRARFGAVYTLIGAISAPITFLSIRIVDRTIHPAVIGTASSSAQGGFNMTGDMKVAFFFSLFAFSVVFATLLWNRIRMGRLAHHVEQLKLKSLD